MLAINDTDIQWDEENFRDLTGMELGRREKQVPGLLWIDYIGAIVSDLVSNPFERGRYLCFRTRIHHQNVPNNQQIVNMSERTKIVCIGKYCG